MGQHEQKRADETQIISAENREKGRIVNKKASKILGEYMDELYTQQGVMADTFFRNYLPKGKDPKRNFKGIIDSFVKEYGLKVLRREDYGLDALYADFQTGRHSQLFKHWLKSTIRRYKSIESLAETKDESEREKIIVQDFIKKFFTQTVGEFVHTAYPLDKGGGVDNRTQGCIDTVSAFERESPRGNQMSHAIKAISAMQAVENLYLRMENLKKELKKLETQLETENNSKQAGYENRVIRISDKIDNLSERIKSLESSSTITTYLQEALSAFQTFSDRRILNGCVVPLGEHLYRDLFHFSGVSASVDSLITEVSFKVGNEKYYYVAPFGQNYGKIEQTQDGLEASYNLPCILAVNSRGNQVALSLDANGSVQKVDMFDMDKLDSMASNQNPILKVSLSRPVEATSSARDSVKISSAVKNPNDFSLKKSKMEKLRENVMSVKKKVITAFKASNNSPTSTNSDPGHSNDNKKSSHKKNKSN